MPALTSNSVGSSASSDAEGTTVGPRCSKKRRNRSRISADLIAASHLLHRRRRNRARREARPRVAPRSAAPPPTTPRTARLRHQPEPRCPQASTCLRRPSPFGRSARPRSRRARCRTRASLRGPALGRLPRRLLRFPLLLHPLADVLLVTLTHRAADAVGEGRHLDRG